MKPRSKSRALLLYLGTSFGWLILMTVWVLLIVPYIDPRCYTSASFGFLPVAIVVPFLMLPLYVVSVAVHAVFAFYKKRFDAREAEGVPLFGLDAVFFVPFTVLSLIAFMPATHWDKSLHCFLMTCAIVLPWILTPLINTRLLALKN
jgi:hypothetical protein